jgi:hypothetical protein
VKIELLRRTTGNVEALPILIDPASVNPLKMLVAVDAVIEIAPLTCTSSKNISPERSEMEVAANEVEVYLPITLNEPPAPPSFHTSVLVRILLNVVNV